MKKTTEWESEIAGKYYKFSHVRIKGKHVLTVNGTPIEIKNGFMSRMFGVDEKFMLDDTEARLVFVRSKPDVVVNGVFLQSGKKYIQRPAWSLPFAVICMLIPIVSLGGAVSIALGVAGSTLCISVSKNALPIAVRIILCIVITLLAWSLCFILTAGPRQYELI